MDTIPSEIERRIIPEPNTGCWLWTGHTNGRGYGRAHINRKRTAVIHRLIYELLVGKVPDGMVLDHLCKTTLCCNPKHLEVVTQRENVLRGLAPLTGGAAQAAKTHCPSGHTYDLTNTVYVRGRSGGFYRQCRACNNARKRRAYAEKIRPKELGES